MVLFEVFALWTGLAYLMEMITFRRTRSFVGEVRKSLKSIPNEYNPFVSMIIPFKGMDYKMEENIKTILNQDYQNHETIFVFDSESDDAYPLLKKFSNYKNVKLVKSKPIPTSSGKVAALLSGIEKAKGDVLVFADSDIMPTRKWLRELIMPLSDKSVGVATTYRLYFPVKNNFVSCLKSAWNASHIGIMFSKYNFVWGGSFAIKRELFEHFNIKEKWQTSISDDTVITKSVRKANLKIQFVPQSLVSSFDHSTWSGLKEFTNRQMFFVRHFDKNTWKHAFLIYGYFNLVWITGIVSLILGFFNPMFFLIGFLLLLTQGLSVIRIYSRDNALQKAVPEYKSHFNQYRKKCMLADLLVKPLMMYNIIKSVRMKKITWRGREYQI